MSRIGKKIVTVPKEVKLDIKPESVGVTGPKGTLSVKLPVNIVVELKDSEISVKRITNDKNARAAHGLVRMLIANMIHGVTQGYSKELSVIGVGFKVQLQGNDLKLQIGFSHDVIFPVPQEVKAEVGKQNKVIISGIDKQKVGDVAARLRALYPPEPYKGKGIRYVDEIVKKKAGKKVTK